MTSRASRFATSGSKLRLRGREVVSSRQRKGTKMRTWNRPPIIALLSAIAMLALAGCTQREAPLMGPGGGKAALSEAVSPYTLAFISRVYDSESNQTTFTYQLQNTNATEPAPATGVLGVFTSVMVEVPDCAGAPDAFTPPDGAALVTNPIGIHGVEWGVGYDDNPNFYYSVSFPGDVPAGTVRGMVTRGGQRYVQSLTGPCEGTFEVSGTVFTDTNGDGLKGLTEFGVANVTVTLDDGEDPPVFATTDADGKYLFETGEGTFTVRVNAVTSQTDFNETLFHAWNPTTATSRSVTVGPDSFGNSFGFDPNVDNIVAGIDDGTYPTDGKSFKWWRRELQRAIAGQHNTAYTPAQLLDFCHQIQALALLDEYNFTPGNELQEAYDILNNHAFGDDDGTSIMLTTKSEDQGRHDAFAFLLRELLTTEFNHVSGKGLSDKALQAVLVNWGEGVLHDNSDAAEVYGGPTVNSLTSPLEDGGTIFKKVNGATGGGGTGN